MIKFLKLSLIIILIFLLCTLLLKKYYKKFGYLGIGSVLDSSNNLTDKIELGNDDT